ncbi:MAG: DUF4430 domain-containing protein [Ruminococcaceae bacterium]|nr:DUF4430 domain-containing protein [Oscillospiraceae bacterium]
MKKNYLIILKSFFLCVLIAVMAFSLVACGDKDENKLGEEITITVAVVNKAGETTEREITTKATNLADALIEAGMVEGYTDTYGYTITAVNGEVADFNVDSSYWAISKEGEYLMSGASGTKIADGEHYELTYTVY